MEIFSDINSQLHRFVNVGKCPQTNLPVSVTALNTHQWKEPSPSFLSPTSTPQSFFHPPSTALGAVMWKLPDMTDIVRYLINLSDFSNVG